MDKLNEIGGALLAGDDADEGIDLFATSEAEERLHVRLVLVFPQWILSFHGESG